LSEKEEEEEEDDDATDDDEATGRSILRRFGSGEERHDVASSKHKGQISTTSQFNGRRVT
jgi:hypothetical protein